jgi:glutamate dehydrogenase (NAD(P)+)
MLEALKSIGLSASAARASIQGFGNVAQHAARRFVDAGGTVIAVASWDPVSRQAYTYRKPGGINPDELRALTDRFGTIDRAAAARTGYDVLPGSAWLEQEVDLLIPAALEQQITLKNAPRVHGRVRMVVEAANGPTTADAARLLEERGVVIVPDIIANAGGVTCSYFEQVQGHANYYWDRVDVLAKLDARMTAAFADVQDRASRDQVSLRDAASLIAVERVARACRERGWV